MKEFGHPRRSHMPPGAGNQAQVSEKRFHTSLRVGIQLWHIVTCQNLIWPLAPCAPITLFFNNWHDDVNAPDAKVGLGLDPNQSGCTNQGSQLSRLDWVNRGHLKLGQPDPVGLVFNQTWLWPDSSQPDLCLTIPGEITSSMLAYKKKKVIGTRVLHAPAQGSQCMKACEGGYRRVSFIPGAWRCVGSTPNM